MLHCADDPVVEEGEEGDGDDAHHHGVGNQDRGGIHGLHPQHCEAKLCNNDAGVGPLHLPLPVHSLELEELDQVVEKGEDDDGQDVTKTLTNTALQQQINSVTNRVCAEQRAKRDQN